MSCLSSPPTLIRPGPGASADNGIMGLKAFMYPLPETRLIHAGRTVYKLKMRYSHHIREDLGINREQVGQELEESIRAVLGNLDNLQPFTTVHFTIFPYKNKWERLSELRFKQGSRVLISYPYVCTLYIELRASQQHSYAAKDESPLTDCSLAENLTGEAVATVANGAKKKEVEKSQLQRSRKRARSATDINDKEHMNDSSKAGRKKRQKQVKRPAQVNTPCGRQTSSTVSDKTPDAMVLSNDKDCKEPTNCQQQPKPGSLKTIAGGILKFLSSAFLPFHMIFGTKRPQ
ncbi:uncharacterized protein [Mobula birostris]|uniref:uncharacterized protein isoform X2 n=1 Tax=Mobula birostris TaxID=1983395 RepID=UPI003B27EF19